MVEALDLLSFGSETGMALLRLRVAPQGKLHLVQIEEALHVLGNAARARSIGWACEAEPAGRFTVVELVQALLAPAGCEEAAWGRVFTYAYAQIEGGPADPAVLDRAAWRLSRHYTQAYRPGADHMVGTVLSRTFADAVHAASMEGIATLTVPETTFMREAFGTRVRTCYLPLAILAFHEHVQLLDMAQRAAGALAGAGVPPGAGRHGRALRQLIDGFLSFRLRYRLAVVSDITMHNQFYAAVRTGLEVDALTRKLAGDTADAARALQAAELQAEHTALQARERGRAWLMGLFAGLLTFLTSLALLKEIRELIEHREHMLDWAPAVAAAVLALASGWLTARRHHDTHGGGAEREDGTGDELRADLEGEGMHAALPVRAAVAPADAAVLAPPGQAGGGSGERS